MTYLIYTRVSSDEQARQGTSLEGQQDSCQAYAKVYEHPVAGVITDGGQSGKSLKRPGMQSVIEQVKAGRVAGVIVYKLDRLTRSLRDLIDLMDLFDRHQVALISVTEKLDTSTPTGRLMVNLIGAVAQWERETIVARVTEGMARRKAEGGWLGGKPPRGTVVVGEGRFRGLQADRTEGPIVGPMWQMAVEGASLRDLAAYAREHGLAGRWAAEDVRRVLSNQRYIGVLVDRATFEAAAQAIEARRRSGTTGPMRSRKKQRRVWLLGQVGRCGRCGSALHGVSARGQGGKLYSYYRCTGRMAGDGCAAGDIPAEAWEALVVEALLLQIGDGSHLVNALKAEAAQLRAKAGPAEARHRDLVLNRDRIRQAQDQLLDLYLEGGTSADQVRRRLDRLQGELAGAEQLVAESEGRLAAAAVSEADVDHMVAQWRQGLEHFAQATPEQQEAVIRALAERIELDRDADHLKIVFRPAIPRKARTQTDGAWVRAKSSDGTPHVTATRTRVSVTVMVYAKKVGRSRRWVARVARDQSRATHSLV